MENISVFSCKQCGKCCFYEIPVTLSDINRIAKNINIADEVVFNENIQGEVSNKSGLFKITKKENSACFFLNNKDKCFIHKVKLNVCTFYTCLSAILDDILPWTISKVRPMHCRFTPCPLRTKNNTEFDCLSLGCGTVEEQFQHQTAMMFTRKYVSKNGSKYNKKEVKKALKDIDSLFPSHIKFMEFCKNISSFRYIDDTLTFC